jgi:large-conductance mechanosensitive channel
MKNNTKFEKAYKLRFVPLVIAVIVLATVAMRELGQQMAAGAPVISFGKYSIGALVFTIAAFIYAVVMNERKKEMDKKEEQARDSLLPSEERLQKQYTDEMRNEESVQKNNIMIRSVYLFLSVLILILGVSAIIERQYLFGASGLILGALLTTHSIFLLRKWIKLLKFFREEKKRNIFDDETDDSK